MQPALGHFPRIQAVSEWHEFRLMTILIAWLLGYYASGKCTTGKAGICMRYKVEVHARWTAGGVT